MTVERGLEAHRLALENEQYRKELIRRERLARELEIAREIQRYILPPQCPDLDGYEMAVEYRPAREVGGDLYDLDLVRQTLRIVIGDVSGKSIPAALYGAVFSGQMRTLFAQTMAPAKMLSLLNSNLIARYQANNHIAVACLKLNLETGEVIIANGGMPFPYLLRGKELSRITAAGVPLGLMDDATYDEHIFQLEKGDLLILTSDGTTDAVSPEGELYDSNRLEESIRSHSSEGVTKLLESLCSGIDDFTHETALDDDITLIALRRL
jgi:sigma-B regulation protein RsbU (phosphoserine phosphatase)